MSESSTDADQLKAYLAGRDVPCPGCGYNLRGVAEPVCPECEYKLVLQQIKSGLFRDLNAYCKLMYASQSALIFVGVLVVGLGAVSGFLRVHLLLGIPFVVAGCVSFVGVRAVRRRVIHQPSNGIPRAELYTTGCVTPFMVIVASGLFLLIFYTVW